WPWPYTDSPTTAAAAATAAATAATAASKAEASASAASMECTATTAYVDPTTATRGRRLFELSAPIMRPASPIAKTRGRDLALKIPRSRRPRPSIKSLRADHTHTHFTDTILRVGLNYQFH